MENPIYNPAPNSGVKGQNTTLKTTEYQIIKILRAVVKGIELIGKAVLTQIKDVIKEIVRPGSSSRY